MKKLLYSEHLFLMGSPDIKTVLGVCAPHTPRIFRRIAARSAFMCAGMCFKIISCSNLSNPTGVMRSFLRMTSVRSTRIAAASTSRFCTPSWSGLRPQLPAAGPREPHRHPAPATHCLAALPAAAAPSRPPPDPPVAVPRCVALLPPHPAATLRASSSALTCFWQRFYKVSSTHIIHSKCVRELTFEDRRFVQRLFERCNALAKFMKMSHLQSSDL